jgi:CRP/FNR family cyclic AMP-dependent transcriptional regulator
MFTTMTQIRTYLGALMAVDDRPLKLAEGAVLFAAGAPGREMFIVRTGTVILKAGERTLEVVGAGDVVGEMALIDPAPRSATAVAGADCTVTSVTEHTFQDLVKKVPGLAIEVMRIIVRRLRRANEIKAAADAEALAQAQAAVAAAAPAPRPSRARQKTAAKPRAKTPSRKLKPKPKAKPQPRSRRR